MYCQECGMKLPDSAKFCSNCGTKVYVTPLQSQELSEEVQDELSAAETDLPVKKQKKNNKKSKKKLLGIIAGVFVVLAVVVGSFLRIWKTERCIHW